MFVFFMPLFLLIEKLTGIGYLLWGKLWSLKERGMIKSEAERLVERASISHQNVGGSAAAASRPNRGEARVIRRRALALAMAALTAATVGCGSSHSSRSGSAKAPAKGLWVANRASQTVVEFKGTILKKAGVSIPTPAAANSSPGLDGPLGLTFDSADNQWVANRDGDNVVEFKLSTLKNLAADHAPAADVTISDDGSGAFLHTPQIITFENGNLWVANYKSGPTSSGKGFITEYLASQLASSGAPTPNVTQIDSAEFAGPDGIAFDSEGNLFVADFDAAKVWVFKASTVAGWSGVGVNTPSDAQLSDTSSLNPTAVAIDHSGNLWAADCEGETSGGGELYMFPKGTLTTTATTAAVIFKSITVNTSNGPDQSLNCPGAIAFDQKGNLWYSNFISSAGAGGSVGEFLKSQLAASGASSPAPNIYLEGDTGLTVFDRPEGIVFGPAL